MNQTHLNDLIFTLSDNMSNSKQDLLVYIAYFHDIASQEYEDAEFLVQTYEDLNMWVELWDGNPDEIGEANWKLREWKVMQRLDDIEDAKDLVSYDAVDFVETYFVQPCGDRIHWELERVLGEMSFKELWDIHRKWPMARIEYY